MCRIQQEISSKIQEQKAAEIQEDEGTDTKAVEERSAEEQSCGDLGAEELCHCRRESVGTARTRLMFTASDLTAGL